MSTLDQKFTEETNAANIADSDQQLGYTNTSAGGERRWSFGTIWSWIVLNITANAAAVRTALGLGNAATKDTGTTTGTVCAGDDSRLSDARTPTSHTHAQSEITDLAADLAAKADLDASNITASTWLTALGIGQHIAASGSITITDGSGFSQLAWGGVVDDGDSQLVTLSTTLSDGDYRVMLYNDDGTALASCDYYIYSRTATTFRVMTAKPATYKYEVILS